MPEGDTIYRAAQRLRVALEGQRIVSSQGTGGVRQLDSLEGTCVVGVESRGKHLLIHFDNNRTLHSHLGMHGAWRVLSAGTPSQPQGPSVAVELVTDHHRIVCFRPKTLELLTGRDLLRHEWLNRLGPDLLGPAPDDVQVVQRFRSHDARTIGEVVMDQSVVCGIGNVYKSEILFLEQIHPQALVESLSDDRILAVVKTAAKLLRRNLTTKKRTTRFRPTGPRVWVYDRGGEHCLRCDAPIRMIRQGELARSTWYCPECQS